MSGFKLFIWGLIIGLFLSPQLGAVIIMFALFVGAYNTLRNFFCWLADIRNP